METSSCGIAGGGAADGSSRPLGDIEPRITFGDAGLVFIW